MATTRPRHMITETAPVSEALAAAAARWPGETPAQLLRRLVGEGHAALKASAQADHAAIDRTAGALTGTYEPGYLETLHEEWPA